LVAAGVNITVVGAKVIAMLKILEIFSGWGRGNAIHACRLQQGSDHRNPRRGEQMKRAMGALVAALCLSPFAVSAADVYSPGKGVLCDKKSGFCSDREGISLALTKEYLGPAAEQKMLSMMQPVENFDATHFVMSNHVSCDTKARVCTKSKLDDRVESTATMALFGKLPPSAPPDENISFPHEWVICDKKSGFCVDDQGISMALTKEYLGQAAQDKMMTVYRSIPTFDGSVYVLSNGVECNSAQKRCVTERQGSDVERRYTKHLFGNE
jgi:hypothetical protein